MSTEKKRAYQRAWYQKNKKREVAKQRAWRKANPEHYREMSRRHERKRKLKRYGLTEAEYWTLLQDQGGVCAICKKPKDHERDYHVDHCHTTGKVRGVLCHQCNMMLGHAKDNPATLTAGVAYLKETI